MVMRVQVDLICIGSELLTGLVENTNAGYISRRLWSCGIPVREQRVVPDSIPHIAGTLRESLRCSEVAICIGGSARQTMISPGRRFRSCWSALYAWTGNGCCTWSRFLLIAGGRCRRQTANRPLSLPEAAW